MASTVRRTALLVRPTPATSATSSSRGSRLRHPAACGGRAPAGRSARSSTRCSTPMVSRLPQTGQRSPAAGLGRLQADAAALVPAQVVTASSGNSSTGPRKPTPVSSARRMAK